MASCILYFGYTFIMVLLFFLLTGQLLPYHDKLLLLMVYRVIWLPSLYDVREETLHLRHKQEKS